MESAYVFYGSLYNARDKIVEEPSILLDPEVDAFLGWGERAAMQAEGWPGPDGGGAFFPPKRDGLLHHPTHGGIHRFWICAAVL